MGCHWSPRRRSLPEIDRNWASRGATTDGKVAPINFRSESDYEIALWLAYRGSYRPTHIYAFTTVTGYEICGLIGWLFLSPEAVAVYRFIE
jgi:hypothetical protein